MSEFEIGDLRDPPVADYAVRGIEDVYQLAADMGEMVIYLYGEHDAVVLQNSATINLNMLASGPTASFKQFFYSSSACIIRSATRWIPITRMLRSFSLSSGTRQRTWMRKVIQRAPLLCLRPHYGINVHVAQLHNIFGPEGTWTCGREKAPPAICRKVAEAPVDGEIEIWGDGLQTRSFLFVECVEGVRRLMDSNFAGSVNTGSEEMVTINELAQAAMESRESVSRFATSPPPGCARTKI